jgi:hypothetical protein
MSDKCLYTIWNNSAYPVCGEPAQYQHNTVPLCARHYEMAINLTTNYGDL